LNDLLKRGLRNEDGNECNTRIDTQIVRHYRKAIWKEKSLILNEIVHTTGYNRSYVATLLRGYGKKILLHNDKKALLYQTQNNKCRGSGRPMMYPLPVRDALEWFRGIFGHKCGRLLVSLIHNNIESLRRWKQISDLREKGFQAIRTVSLSPVDRILRAPGQKLRIKGTYFTHSNTGLRTMIPIRTFSSWKEVSPGHFQINCVGHDGGVVSGQFCFTLTVVDVFSDWCERRGPLNRTHRWVIEALDLMRADSPVQFVKIYPNNGSDFINNALLKHCKKVILKITLSRPGKKNDNCYVGKKKIDVVRKIVWYAHYGTLGALWLLNELHRVQGLLQNHVSPFFKLVEKTRVGFRYIRKYDNPKTPAMRFLEDPRTDQGSKEKIREIQKGLHPVALVFEVVNLQERLLRYAGVL